MTQEVLESMPLRLLCSVVAGWQVMRMDWSTPREVVKSSLGDTSDSSDWKENIVTTTQKRASQGEHNGANFNSIAPSCEELRVRKEI